jgi:hypothetical protein
MFSQVSEVSACNAMCRNPNALSDDAYKQMSVSPRPQARGPRRP